MPAPQQNSFSEKNGPSFPCHAYSHFSVLRKHLSRESLQHDRLEQQTITDIKEQLFSEKWFHKKALSNFMFSFFFFSFSQGIHFKQVKGMCAFPLTSTPDVWWAQGQPVRQGYCFLSSAVRLSSTANQILPNTWATSELHQPDQRKTVHNMAATGGTKPSTGPVPTAGGLSVQSGQAFS